MVRKMMLGMFLALFAMAAQADAAAMLFKVTGITSGQNFGGSPIASGDTFWLKLNVTPQAASAGTAVTSFISGDSRLYRVGNWADDLPGWGVAAGPNSNIIFGDFSPGAQTLSFNVQFTNGAKLNFGYFASPAFGGQTNEISVGNLYKFINATGNNPAGLAFGNTLSGASVTAIPEPSSMAALGLLTTGLGFVARRRRKGKVNA